MSKNSFELQSELKDTITLAEGLVNKSDKMSDEDQDAFAKLQTRATELKEEIATAQRKEYLAGEQALLSKSERKTQPSQPKKATGADRTKALRGWLKMSGSVDASTDEWQAAMDCGIDLRSNSYVCRTDMGTTNTGGEFRGFDVQGELVKALKAFGGMYGVSSVKQTTDGNAFNWPMTDFTNKSAGYVDELDDFTDTNDIPSDKVAFPKCPTLRSDLIVLGREFIQDSGIDVEAWVTEACSQSIARKLNYELTKGSTSGKIRGILSDSTEGESDSVYSADVVKNLVASVDPAYRANAKFMMHDTTFWQLYNLEAEDGRSLFWNANMSLSDAIPLRLLGYPVVINQDMPDGSSNGQKTILFGDFSYYKVREVTSVEFIRLQELYAKQLAIGIAMYARYDGRLVNPGSTNNPVKHFTLTGSI